MTYLSGHLESMVGGFLALLSLIISLQVVWGLFGGLRLWALDICGRLEGLGHRQFWDGGSGSVAVFIC